VGDLVEIGVDVLNPNQPACLNLEHLKEAYGDKLCFWGSIDEQQTLPFGSPEDVRREVEDRSRVLGRHGGLILGPTHHVQLDTPMVDEDPVGKRVDPAVRYMPDDRFYVDFITSNLFEHLEQYGRAIRLAQRIELNIYDFPTVCLWYANHGGYGGGKATNDTVGAVAEMEEIRKVTGGGSYVVAIATNGYAAQSATVNDSDTRAELETIDGKLVKLTLTRGENAIVEWAVRF
jgi:hypothetical protein